MEINQELIERLLYEEESNAIDFKRDQYPFKHASNEEKSELLKDIIAFANSWRRTDGFIVIGVEEIKGGRSNVVGISTQLDDADVRQFVNSKTNKPIEFSYRAIDFQGNLLGVIHIPLQRRPFFSKEKLWKTAGELCLHTERQLHWRGGPRRGRFDGRFHRAGATRAAEVRGVLC